MPSLQHHSRLSTDRVFAVVKNKLNEAKEDLEDASDDVENATQDEEKVDSNSGAAKKRT